MYKGPDQPTRARDLLQLQRDALSIADPTDKKNPVHLAAAYPNVAYTHQGWLTDDHRYFYLDDEVDESSGAKRKTRTLVWDLADLYDPMLVKEHWAAKAIDHNLYVKGDRMYQANYRAGLRILDISDPPIRRKSATWTRRRPSTPASRAPGACFRISRAARS